MAKTKDYDMRAANRYRAANCRDYTLRLNKKFDQTLIDYLDSIGNKSGYLKRLVQEDMKSGN